MCKERKYLFGPVPSRRLGRSLGVDIIPLKTCTQNCIYCQLGVDGKLTLERKAYVPLEKVIEEIRDEIAGGLEADFITLSGSGEPTLNSQIGELIDSIRQITDIPIAVITNGTLLNEPEVRAGCGKADVVLPSLDAGDEKVFCQINRPHKDISFESFIEGLCKFRLEFSGQIWLEVFFIEGINAASEQIERIKALIQRIKPDKVQLNTAVRPTADKSVLRVEPQRLDEIARQIGPGAEVIADYSKDTCEGKKDAGREKIISMLRRRPCSIDDIYGGLGIEKARVQEVIECLGKEGLIETETSGDDIFYKLKS